MCQKWKHGHDLEKDSFCSDSWVFAGAAPAWNVKIISQCLFLCRDKSFQKNGGNKIKIPWIDMQSVSEGLWPHLNIFQIWSSLRALALFWHNAESKATPSIRSSLEFSKQTISKCLCFLKKNMENHHYFTKTKFFNCKEKKNKKSSKCFDKARIAAYWKNWHIERRTHVFIMASNVDKHTKVSENTNFLICSPFLFKSSRLFNKAGPTGFL